MSGGKVVLDNRARFLDAREEWPTDELLEVAIRCIVRHPDDMEKTQRAIMRACRSDDTLLRSLMLPWWRQCTASIIGEARRTIEHKERTSALATAIERRAAKVVSLERERGLAEEKRERDEALAAQAKLNELHQREFEERIAAWKRTKASSFIVNERPVWEVSTFAARQWQIRHAHRAKFVDLLLSGLPEDERPISYYRRPEEVDALWDQAFQDGG